MSKILANQIANYGDDSPIEIKEGLNIPTGKPLQAAGESGSSGQLLSSTGSSVEWVTPFDGSYNSLTDKPSIPSAQVQSDWNAVGTLGEILNKPIVPPTPSVVVSAPGVSNLTYGVGNGQFTYTPPDLSSFATTTSLTTSVANSGNWDTAYGWGDHAQVGYLTAEADTLDSVCERGKTLAYGQYICLTDVRIVGTDGIKASFFGCGALGGNSQGDLTMRHNDQTHDSSISHGNTLGDLTISSATRINLVADTGSGNITVDGNLLVTGTTDLDIEDLNNVDISGGLSDQQVLKWDSASSSWLPANDLVGGVDGIALADLSVSTAAAGTAALSYNNTNGVFTYTPPDLSGYALNTNVSNWDTAYGWGDHSQAGYLTTETDPVFAASPAASVTLTKINQWDTAYGWGNHANGGYLVATAQDKTNWNTAFGWGDHSQAGYLTAETDTLATVLARGNSTSLDITTTGKLYYSNNFADLTALNAVNATTYHGMFAHVHAEGHGYFAHGGAWTQLLDTGSSLDELADVSIPSASLGDVLRYNGSNWEAANVGTTANATISDTAPGSPVAGDLWWESDKGRLKIYYNDTDSNQWVDASPPLTQDRIASSSAPSSATDNGVPGDIRYDSSYVYICISNNTWKRAALATW